MRIAIVGGLAALVLASTAPNATADIGPRDPALRICSGLREGAACTIHGKPGTCHGPHVSRLYCDPKQPPSEGSGSAAADPGSGSAATGSGSAAADPGSGSAAADPGSGSAAADPGHGSAAAGSAQAPDPGNAEPATTPGHKRGCAVADPGSAAGVGLAFAALAWRRRRRSRSMS
jgi:MYXO-CTERM domain-containing protein